MTACPVGYSVSSKLRSCLQAVNILLMHRTGASAFVGLGAYIYFSGHKALKERGHIIVKQRGAGSLRWRVRGIALLASSFVGMGLYRLVN